MKYKFMRKTLPLIALMGILLSVIFTPASIAAAESDGQSGAQIQHVYDKAELLSTSELNNIEEMCTTYSEDAGIDIMILTHDDSNAVEAEQYIEDFYDQADYGDAVILLIDMYNRKVCIEGYGTAMTYINSFRGDDIRNEITPYLTDGDYVTAFQKYIKKSDEFMKKEPSGSSGSSSYNGSNSYSNNDYSNDGYTSYGSNSTDSAAKNILMNIWVQLAAALVIGAVAVGIMAFNAGGRMTVNGNSYIDPNHSGLIGRSDDYIRTQVTRVHKPQNNTNNNFGGGSGGISAGGSSHSTSSGSF